MARQAGNLGIGVRGGSRGLRIRSMRSSITTRRGAVGAAASSVSSSGVRGGGSVATRSPIASAAPVESATPNRSRASSQIPRDILRPNPLDIPISGSVELHEGKRGGTWYARWRDGRGQHRKRIGPAWTRSGPPDPGYYRRREAKAALDAIL